MNILMVSVIFPYPLEGGASSAIHKVLDYVRKTHQITLLCPEGKPEDVDALKFLWSNVDIVTFKNNPPVTHGVLGSIKRSLLSKNKSKNTNFRTSTLLQNTNLIDYYFQDLLPKLNQLFINKSFDLVQVDLIELASIVNFIPKNIKKIFVHHELRYKRMMLEYSTLSDKNMGDLWRIENIKTLELGLLNKYDKVLTLTEQDLKYLEEDGIEKSKLVVSPSPVDTKDKNINKNFEFNNRLVFIGPDFHFPNLDAIDWFLENCWSKLLLSNPFLSFDVIGIWKKENVAKYSKFKNVNFRGFVDNLAGLMEGAILVVPLRIGSGMRMKILEGVSWHVPIISTTIGAEGLPMIHGENCFIADNSKDFISSVIKLTADNALQKTFVEKSANIIKNDFSVENCGEIRNKIYEEFNKEWLGL